MNKEIFEKKIKLIDVGKSFLSNHSIADNIIMIVAMCLVNLFSYGYQLTMGILLTPEDYGTLLSLISLLAIINVVTQTVTSTAAVTIAKLEAENNFQMIGNYYVRSLKVTLLLGTIIFVILALCSPVIALYFHLGSIVQEIILFSTFVIAFPLAQNWGILQGLQKFVSFGVNQALTALFRALTGILLVILGFGVNGGLAALPLSLLFPFLITLWILKRFKKSSIEEAKIIGTSKYAIAALISFVAITMLTNIDIIMAKHYLNPVDAGNYSALAVLGRIAFFAPAGIAMVLFPKSTKSITKGENNNKNLLVGISSTLIIVGVICLLYGLFPDSVTRLLFSNKYNNVSPFLFEYGIALSLMSIAYLGITYALSIGKTWIAYPFLVVVIFQIGILLFVHDSVSDFSRVMLLSGGLSTIVIMSLLYFSSKISFRKNRISK